MWRKGMDRHSRAGRQNAGSGRSGRKWTISVLWRISVADYGRNGFSSVPALIVASSVQTPQRTGHSTVVTRSVSPCRTGRATEQCGQVMPIQQRSGT